MKWENFTAARVAAFSCPEGKTKQKIYWDGKTPGLGIRVTQSGAKSYIFEASLNNKTLRMTIGDVQTYSVDAAQRQASEYKALTNQGIDPRLVISDRLAANEAKTVAAKIALEAEEKHRELETARAQVTGRMAWQHYMDAPHPKWGDQHRADHMIAASEGGAAAKIGKRVTKPGPLASLLERPLNTITAPVVQQWLTLECESRPTFAHNAFRKFRTFVRWCTKHVKYSELVHADCCLTDEVKDVVPAKKTKEDDCLQREQLKAWFAAVGAISNPVISAYLQALLITGARRNELETLRWDDVVFHSDWASLTIHDKVDGKRTIPFPPYLKRLIEGLPRRNQWVFSSLTAESGHLTEPRIAHTDALEVAGLPHVSLHGLRRSFGTLAEWVEVPAGVVAQIMGHKPSAIAEKHYIRRPLDLLRMWHVKIEAWMLEQAVITVSPTNPVLRVVA